MTIDRLARRVIASRGWERRFIGFMAGALSALAMQPFNLWPVLLLTLPICVWLIDGAALHDRCGWRQAAFSGWWFGFGYFLAGLWWIGSAFLVEADIFGWLLPLPVLGLPAALALFPALGFALAALAWRQTPWRVLAFALALGASEFLRGTVLTGFPWNAFGYALADQLWLGQSASLVGVEGLTFLALLIFAAPAALGGAQPTSRAPLLLGACLLAGLAAFGAARLGLSEVAFRETPALRIVQPFVPRDARFRPSAGPEILDLYLRLSREDPAELADRTGEAPAERKGPAAETLLIWPESAFPFLIERTPDALAAIAAALPSGTVLVTGAARVAENGTGGPTFYNSVMTIQEGRIAQSFDKMHLVPFGEYLPMQALLEGIGLQEIIRRPGGFTAGPADQKNIAAAGVTLRPLICYEAVFPSESAAGERPEAFLNVTDDAWFGTTPGPYQHFAISKVRSIEQGLPLIRAANSGISAVIDPYGRTLAQLSLGSVGVLRASLPRALPPTLYARFGRAATSVLVLLLAIGYLYSTRRENLTSQTICS